MKRERFAYILICLLSISIALVSSCGTETSDGGNSINTNIEKIIDCCNRSDEKYVSGHFYLGQILGDVLIATSSISKFQLSTDFQILSVEEIWRDFYESSFGNANYFTLSKSSNVLLFTKSSAVDATISRGALYEYDLSLKQALLLKDSTYNISTAVYWHGDDNRLIYYSYGNDDGLEAGYYLYDKTTDTESLLLAHHTEKGPFSSYDRLNGFDFSPDNRRLLIPNVRASFTGGLQAPQIIEYDLHTQQADTFDVAFDLSFERIGLWLRYSPDGNRILYSQYPMNPFGGTANDDSEVGIIELPSRQKRVLDVNTNERNTRQSIQLAPTWSPDGQHIVYGSTPLFMPEGRAGYYSLYILKNVDDPQNYK